MPQPPHDMFTFSGVFGSPDEVQEIWSWSVKTNSANSAEPAIATALRARSLYDQTIRTIMPSSVVLTQVRHSKHGAGGRVLRRADGTYDQADATEPLPGAGAQSFMPLQTALCVTLDTIRPGASGKGRFFLPWPALTLNGAFSLSVQDGQRVADVTRNFLARFLEVGEGNPQNVLLGSPVVVSAGPDGGSGAGAVSTVTGIRVGLVPDTMRSRRNALTESYITRTVG